MIAPKVLKGAGRFRLIVSVRCPAQPAPTVFIVSPLLNVLAHEVLELVVRIYAEITTRWHRDMEAIIF